MRRIVYVLVTLAVGAACGTTAVRRPNVPAGAKVQELRQKAGDRAQNCGEVVEPKAGATCEVRAIGQCLASALGHCRAAYGSRTYFTAESDAIRVDWLVMPDAAAGTCHLTVVDDRSADPLAPRAPTTRDCKAVTWKPHESIPSCEAPVPEKCDADKPAG
jgi:hypothetical protein